jgi:cytochrome P450
VSGARRPGAGPHRCIGASLARIEIQALLGEWLKRIPDFEVEPGFTPTIGHDEEGPTCLAALPLRWSITDSFGLGGDQMKGITQ